MKRKRLSEKDYEVDLSHEEKRLLQRDETILNQVQHNVEHTRSSFLDTAQFIPTRAPVGESTFFL